MSINYKTIDLFEYVDSMDEAKIIIHVCNDKGAWGAGFVIPLGQRYPMAEDDYRNTSRLILGQSEIMCPDPENETWVGNMIAQTLGWEKGRPPIRYESLKSCLIEIAEFCEDYNVQKIVAPRFGAGLAGGKWEVIEKLIEETIGHLDVTICDLPQKS